MQRHTCIGIRSAICVAALGGTLAASATFKPQSVAPQWGLTRHLQVRADASIRSAALRSVHYGQMSPAERRAAIDAEWGPGPSTEEKLRIFDTL
jgi:hypothetical protein